MTYYQLICSQLKKRERLVRDVVMSEGMREKTEEEE